MPGKNCPTYKDCYYYRDRRRAQHARSSSSITLFFSDLALREHGVSLLPEYHTAIFDESRAYRSGCRRAPWNSGHERTGRIRPQQTLQRPDSKGFRSRQIYSRAATGCQLLFECCRTLRGASRMALRKLANIRNFNGRVREPIPVENHLTADLTNLAITSPTCGSARR